MNNEKNGIIDSNKPYYCLARLVLSKPVSLNFLLLIKSSLFIFQGNNSITASPVRVPPIGKMNVKTIGIIYITIVHKFIFSYYKFLNTFETINRHK